MKKTVVGILAAIMALSIITISALAAGNGNGRNFVDSNSDGVCDNLEPGICRGQNFVDLNGDGICDNLGQGKGRGCGLRGGHNR